MKPFTGTWKTVVFVLWTAMVTVGCQGETEQTENIALRTYSVPEGYATDEVSQSLESVLASDSADQQLGRVSVTPSGELLVATTKTRHEGVREVIERLKKSKPSPRRSIELTYWFVRGKRTETAEYPPADEIREVLETVVESQGSMAFEMVDRLSVRTLEKRSWHIGHEITGQTSGNITTTGHVGINGQAWIEGGQINASFGIRGQLGSMDLNIGLEAGQTVILGQVGAGMDSDAMFYVVRARTR